MKCVILVLQLEPKYKWKATEAYVSYRMMLLQLRLQKARLIQALCIFTVLLLKVQVPVQSLPLSKTRCQQDTSFNLAKLSLIRKDLYTNPADDFYWKFYLISHYLLLHLRVKKSCSGAAFCSPSLCYYNRPNLQGTILFAS